MENRLELDSMWGKEIFGIFFQIDLTENVKDLISVYQEELNKIEYGNLLLPPRERLHISVDQVIYWNGKYSLGGKETWREIKDNFLLKTAGFNYKKKSFDITFLKLIATKNAIIFAAFDQADEFQSLRQDLLHELPFPEETVKSNSIIHTTIARFKNNLNKPQAVIDFIRKQKDSATMPVNKIILRKELVYPSLKTEDIAEILLK